MSYSFFKDYLYGFEYWFNDDEKRLISDRIGHDIKELLDSKRKSIEMLLQVKRFLNKHKFGHLTTVSIDLMQPSTSNARTITESGNLKDLSAKCSTLIEELRQKENELRAIRKANEEKFKLHENQTTAMKARIDDLHAQQNINIDGIEKHLREVLTLIGRDSENASTRLTCHLCDKTFTATYTLDLHIQNIHEKGKRKDNRTTKRKQR